MTTAYCTAADLEKRMASVTFSTTTTPKLADVTEFITTRSAQIDGRLSGRFTTPITGTAALAIVKQVCLYLVRADIQEVMEGGKTSSGTDGMKSVDFLKRGLDMLGDIAEGRLDLPDAVSLASDQFYNDNVGETREFTIKKDEEQW